VMDGLAGGDLLVISIGREGVAEGARAVIESQQYD